MKQQQNLFTITHDINTDKYYKIHKISGATTNVYKNGSDLKNFQPGITGFAASVTRIKKLYNPSKQISPRFHTQFNTKEVSKQPVKIVRNARLNLQKYNHTKKLRQMNRSMFVKYNKQQYQKQSIINASNSTIETKIMKNNFKEENNHNKDNQSKTLNSKEIFKKLENYSKNDSKHLYEDFNRTLKQYNHINNSKFFENHSPKKEIPGNNPTKSPQELNLMNYKYFQQSLQINLSENYIKKHKQQKKKKNRLFGIQLLNQYHNTKQQYRKERLTFNKYRQQSSKQKEYDHSRKQNLKKIEQQYIESQEKHTNKIYE